MVKKNFKPTSNNGWCYIHDYNIIHKELFCKNILLDNFDLSRKKNYPIHIIIDFGISVKQK